MKNQVFKIAMLHLDRMKTSKIDNNINRLKKLIDIIKGEGEDKDLPDINNSSDFYEAARTLGIQKNEFPKLVMKVFEHGDSLRLPMGLIGDIGEYLGEKKGVGVIPSSVLERAFLREDLYKKIGPKKWEYFFKDENKFKKFKEQKGF